ncbi:MAG: HisA/HisF-related TIM barrel protein [Candidatus Latescibacterota bacterium]
MMQREFEKLRNGVVLAELGGYGDGPYCAKHGAGAALVMLGTYIVDAGDSVPYPVSFVFRPGRKSYAGYLKEHVSAARSSGAQVGVSVVSVELPDTVDFLRAAEEAGADYASLCAHSIMEMFLRTHAGAALCCREHWDRLREWARAILEAVDIPVIFKVGASDTPDAVGAVEVLDAAGIPIVHVNVGNSAVGAKGLATLESFRGKCACLIAGGGVRDIEGARSVLDAGADSVAIGTAAMKHPDLCGRIQHLLRDG